MSFIPSKLGLRTHLLTQINLALVRVAGEKIYAQLAALLSDPNYGPPLQAGQLNNKGSVVLLLLLLLLQKKKEEICKSIPRASCAAENNMTLMVWL